MSGCGVGTVWTGWPGRGSEEVTLELRPQELREDRVAGAQGRKA